jgi:hypothetical protein
MIYSKIDKENNQDKLSLDMEIKTRKVYKNLTRVKGRMVPVIDWKISLYINGYKLDEDEVFVEDVYFNSLLYPGKYPMFTCTCGIFGCGGYYVDVVHNNETMIWTTEQSPFTDSTFKDSNRFVFSWSNIIEFTEELIKRLEDLKNIMLSNVIEFQYDLDKYKDIIQEIKIKRK